MERWKKEQIIEIEQFSEIKQPTLHSVQSRKIEKLDIIKGFLA